ncbi:uncharacterized protein LOC143257920 [Tachypleus tridentatus]|uniref:uncharacterized protein LOC143257920 n=1 Tax=Tachypleus tridentatus TaxID=6853 RepID=UPI003FD563F4
MEEEVEVYTAVVDHELGLAILDTKQVNTVALAVEMCVHYGSSGTLGGNNFGSGKGEFNNDYGSNGFGGFGGMRSEGQKKNFGSGTGGGNVNSGYRNNFGDGGFGGNRGNNGGYGRW